MDATLFTETVKRLRGRRPFRPFTLRLNDGSYFEVDAPDVLAVRDGIAVGIAPGKIPVRFDHDGVTKVEEDLANNPAGSTATVGEA